MLLNGGKKKPVSPRRLEYIIDAYNIGLNIQDFVNSEENINIKSLEKSFDMINKMKEIETIVETKDKEVIQNYFTLEKIKQISPIIKTNDYVLKDAYKYLDVEIAKYIAKNSSKKMSDNINQYIHNSLKKEISKKSDIKNIDKTVDEFENMWFINNWQKRPHHMKYMCYTENFHIFCKYVSYFVTLLDGISNDTHVLVDFMYFNKNKIFIDKQNFKLIDTNYIRKSINHFKQNNEIHILEKYIKYLSMYFDFILSKNNFSSNDKQTFELFKKLSRSNDIKNILSSDLVEKNNNLIKK